MNHIGEWAHRASGSKSHLVESEVAERYVMRCGREMKQHPKLGRQALIFGEPTWTHPACEQCVGKKPADHVPTLNTRSSYSQ